LDSRLLKVYSQFIVDYREGKLFRGLEQAKKPRLKKGHIGIKVEYSGINYKDVLVLQGNKAVVPEFPIVPGIDAAGIVTESLDPSLKAGDRVLVTGFDIGTHFPGGFSEYLTIPGGWAVPLPRHISTRDAMILGTAGFTAALSLLEILDGDVNQGPVLVTGASGGLGLFALMFAHAAGFTTHAASRTPDRPEFVSLCQQLGVSEILHNDQILSSRPMATKRWRAVIDCLGGKILSSALASLDYSGIAVCSGMLAGSDFSSSVFPFILRGVRLIGIDSVHCSQSARLRAWGSVFNSWYDSSQANLFIHDLPFSQLPDSLDTLPLKNPGRVLLVFPD
jgi:acrylyl-CoA reductase (NADPH)